MTPAELSLNTTRGKAFHAVVRYALWVRRHLEAARLGSEQVMPSFDALAEVRDTLDRHLDPTHDPSPTIRAVFGWSFPILLQLDPLWAAEAVSRIFASGSDAPHLRDAAWDAYVVFNRPVAPVFAVLREEYGGAVERLGTLPREGHLFGQDPNQRLVDHLMTLYWHGVLDFDEQDHLLERFYARAPEVLRRHALEFLGRSLVQTSESPPPDVLGRLQALLERRIQAIGGPASPESLSSECRPFGLWFVSSRFDASWATARLVEVLRLGGKVELDWQVVERLAGLSARLPFTAVQCLRLMVDGDVQGWEIPMWTERARVILSTALRSGDDAARVEARGLINRLGARGFVEFQPLLFA